MTAFEEGAAAWVFPERGHSHDSRVSREPGAVQVRCRVSPGVGGVGRDPICNPVAVRLRIQGGKGRGISERPLFGCPALQRRPVLTHLRTPSSVRFSQENVRREMFAVSVRIPPESTDLSRRRPNGL